MLGKRIAKQISQAITEKSLKDLYKRLSGPSGIISTIVSIIQKGISPVKGVAGRFQKYSDSYKASFKSGELKGKKKSPVNMTATGEMLESLHLTLEGTKFFIKSRGKRNNKLIDIHNRQGASKKKVIRRLLPTEKGEEFTPRVSTLLQKNLKKSVSFSILRFLPKKALRIKIKTSK